MDDLPSVSLPESNALCEICQKGENTFNVLRGPSLQDLGRSAKFGCPLCHLRYLGVLSALGEDTKEDSERRVSFLFRGPITQVVRVWHDVERRDDEFFDADLCVFLYTRVGHANLSCPVVGVGREVGDRRSSYLYVVKEWLRTCHEDHRSCPRNTDVPLPTRVLEVGDAGSEWVWLRVVPGEKGSYAALSHCWGGGIEMRTTTKNIEAQQEGLRYSDLAKSFQHAVSVTRDLGLKYLWIDAFCIIQDDQDDWEKESGNMAAVYQNAYIVLGADMSSNSSGGFIDLEKGGYHGEGTPIAVVGDHGTPIYARSEYSQNNYDYGSRSFGEQPLSKRAWTLQEQLLASKMVHFASKEMIWECSGGSLCECMQLDRDGTAWDLPLSARLSMVRPFLNSPYGMFRTWYTLVTVVTRRDITKPEDLLPCLSGLARHFQNNGAGDYLAGLWRNDLPLGLLWTGSSDSRRAIPYRGPSWSWASISNPNATYGKIAGFSGEFNKFVRCYATILEAKCLPKGKDPLGAVGGGYLKISAPLLELTDDIEIRPEFDCELASMENMFCLFVGEITAGANASPSLGLVLQQQRDFPEPLFERVGWFGLMSGEEDKFIKDLSDSIVTII